MRWSRAEKSGGVRGTNALTDAAPGDTDTVLFVVIVDLLAFEPSAGSRTAAVCLTVESWLDGARGRIQLDTSSPLPVRTLLAFNLSRYIRRQTLPLPPAAMQANRVRVPSRHTPGRRQLQCPRGAVRGNRVQQQASFHIVASNDAEARQARASSRATRSRSAIVVHATASAPADEIQVIMRRRSGSKVC